MFEGPSKASGQEAVGVATEGAAAIPVEGGGNLGL